MKLSQLVKQETGKAVEQSDTIVQDFDTIQYDTVFTLIHEWCHWLVATPWERQCANLALVNIDQCDDIAHRDEAGDIELHTPKREEEERSKRREREAFFLEYHWLLGTGYQEQKRSWRVPYGPTFYEQMSGCARQSKLDSIQARLDANGDDYERLRDLTRQAVCETMGLQ